MGACVRSGESRCLAGWGGRLRGNGATLEGRAGRRESGRHVAVWPYAGSGGVYEEGDGIDRDASVRGRQIVERRVRRSSMQRMRRRLAISQVA